MIEPRLENARNDARGRLARLNMRTAAQIDLDAIAADMGAEFLDDGIEAASARVLWNGRRARIRLSKQIVHPGRVLFTKGHELAHVALEHLLARVVDPSQFFSFVCKRHRDGVRDYEREADVWSTEANMPEELVRPMCVVPRATLATARAIASEFRMSPVASAIRFVELTTARCVAVFSQDGRVKWASPSETFRQVIRKRTKLDPGSVAFDYASRDAGSSDPRVLPADAWFKNLSPDLAGVEILEHAEPVPEENGVLSLIWISDQSARWLDAAKPAND